MIKESEYVENDSKVINVLHAIWVVMVRIFICFFNEYQDVNIFLMLQSYSDKERRRLQYDNAWVGFLFNISHFCFTYMHNSLSLLGYINIT